MNHVILRRLSPHATIAQVAASHPLEKLHRPDTLKPPSTRFAVPLSGFNPLEKSVSGPVAKNSSWTRSEKCPSHQLCVAQRE